MTIIKRKKQNLIIFQSQDFKHKKGLSRHQQHKFFNRFAKKTMPGDIISDSQKYQVVESKSPELFSFQREKQNNKTKIYKQEHLISQFQNNNPYLQAYQYFNQKKKKVSMRINYMKFKSDETNKKRKQQIQRGQRENEHLQIIKSRNSKFQVNYNKATSLNFPNNLSNDFGYVKDILVEDNQTRENEEQKKQRFNSSKLQQILSKIPKCIRYRNCESSKQNSQTKRRLLKRKDKIFQTRKNATDDSQNTRDSYQQIDND